MESNIYEDAKISKTLPTQDSAIAEEHIEADEQVEATSWKPTVPTESPNKRLDRQGVKAEKDGAIVTIKEVFFTRPKTRDAQGNDKEPELTKKNKKPFYPGKLGIRFEEDHLIEYYPNFKYYVNNGVMSTTAKIARGAGNAISNLFDLAIVAMKKDISDVSDQEFYDFLVGKKVELRVKTDPLWGKGKFRNDIVKFL